MHKMFALAMALTAIGCSDDPYTWGDATRRVSDAFCDALTECGYFSSADDTRQCAEHTNYHLCELPGTCDTQAQPELADLVDVCVSDLEMPTADECFLMFFGVVPDSCREVLLADPELAADAG